ncbi:hypothetical protein PsorP6_004289 [Peronosclerospora sorghi]|uniref:Uncharacterized protein n=1 Tax=Peronosclerospora sorghi TaxID=230839 RepID=A0ACC0VJA1_9STRA|nr:hypothetical protein PsorP6_004289 [Peronosclerospora sorghi]
MRESEVSELQDRLAGVVMIVIRTAGPMLSQKDDCCFRLFWILNSLLAMASESSLASETVTYLSVHLYSTQANEGMKELAARLQKPIETLYTRYMGKLLDTMTLPTDVASSWNKNNPSRVLFDSLCRHGGVVRISCNRYRRFGWIKPST